MVLDGTWLVHLPKVVWWLVGEGNLAYFIYRLYQPAASNNSSCYSPGWEQTSSAFIVVSLCWEPGIQPCSHAGPGPRAINAYAQQRSYAQ